MKQPAELRAKDRTYRRQDLDNKKARFRGPQSKSIDK